jgi:hypothetical protein
MASTHVDLARLRYLMVILLDVIVIWNVSKSGDCDGWRPVHQAERAVAPRQRLTAFASFRGSRDH